jgi:hypothetical protein
VAIEQEGESPAHAEPDGGHTRRIDLRAGQEVIDMSMGDGDERATPHHQLGNGTRHAPHRRP